MLCRVGDSFHLHRGSHANQKFLYAQIRHAHKDTHVYKNPRLNKPQNVCKILNSLKKKGRLAKSQFLPAELHHLSVSYKECNATDVI